MSNLKKILPWWLSGGAAEFDSPLQLAPMSNTTIRAWVAQITGATSYKFEYDTDSGFSSPTEFQNTSSNVCMITGLTIDTLYYIRVTPSNALPISGSQRTIPFAVEAWYEIAGIEPDTDNAYGDADAGATVYNVQSIKSIINVSGPSVTLGTNSLLRAVDFAAGVVNAGHSDEAIYSLTGDTTADRTLSSPITLSGNFTIAFKAEHPGAFRTFMDDTTSNSYVVFNSTAQIRVYIDNTQYSYTFGSALNNKSQYDWVIRRTDALLEVSNDGGTTWNTMSASAKTNNFVISALGSDAAPYGSRYDASISRIVIVNSSISNSDCDYIFDYLKSKAFTSSDKAITGVEGVTFETAPSGNAIVGDSNLAIENGMTRRSWMVLNEGDFTFMFHHTNENATDYYQDILFILKHSTGQIATLELPASLDENHLYGGWFKFDGRLIHMEPNAWYDSTNSTGRPNRPIMRLFDKSTTKADLTSYEELTRFNGLFNGISEFQGYYGFFDTANRRFLFSNGFMPSGGQRFLQVQYCDDYLNHWFFNRIMDSELSTLWPYVFYIWHPHDAGEIIIGVNVLDTSTSKYAYAGLIRVSLDGKTVENFAGTFSKDVSRHNWLTWSEFTTNFVFETRTSGEVRIGNAHYDENGEVFLIVGDGGTDAQYKFCYGSPDGALTEKSIDFGGRTMVTSGSAEGGYIHKTGENSYDVYLLADNSGDWQVWKFSTADKGDTWSDEGAISADNTKRHAFIMGTANQLEADNITLSYLRVDDEGAGVADGVAAYVYHDL